MSIDGLRDEFPALRRLAYMNAGTDGPLAARAVQASRDELERELQDGRAKEHFERSSDLRDQLRSRYAALLGSEPANVALTTCTSEGLAHVIAGMRLSAGDEILTSDQEHPGLLGALGAARELRGVSVREVALERIAQECGPRTRLIACSHVGWESGSFAPAELAHVDVPLVLDGAQGVGAVPVDVIELGCDAYAGPGQKWLCGPDGTGMLYLSPRMIEMLDVPRRGYSNLEDPGAGLDASLHADARRFDAFSLNAETMAFALAAHDVLAQAGWPAIHERAAALSAELAGRLAERGRATAPRGPSTLVSFASTDPEGERTLLSEAGVVVRNIPERPWLRASVGAWNDEGDIERLLSALA